MGDEKAGLSILSLDIMLSAKLKWSRVDSGLCQSVRAAGRAQTGAEALTGRKKKNRLCRRACPIGVLEIGQKNRRKFSLS